MNILNSSGHIRTNCPAWGACRRCVPGYRSHLAGSLFACRGDRVGRLCPASASFLTRAGGHSALSIPGGGNGGEAAAAGLSAGQECLCLKHRCLFSRCSIRKMVQLRVSPSLRKRSCYSLLLRLIKTYKRSCSLCFKDLIWMRTMCLSGPLSARCPLSTRAWLGAA